MHYLGALAGAGKTYALARYADRLARRGQKVLFIQPSKELINKTIAHELQPLQPKYPIRAIHSDTDPDRVIAEIVAHFKDAGSGGQVVFITHAAFIMVGYFERRSEWALIVDEIPQVDLYCELNLPNTHELITPYLMMEEDGAAYGLLVEKEARQ